MSLISKDNFISAIKNKDQTALEFVLDNYGNLIKSIINKHLGLLQNYHEECFNDVLLAIWNNIEQYDSEKSSFKNWVAGITRYKSLSYVRKYIHEIEQQDINELENTPEISSSLTDLQEEHDENFEEMLDGLNAQDKELFRRLYLHEQDMNDISNEMNLSTNVIYNRLSRARKKLRTLLNKKGE